MRMSYPRFVQLVYSSIAKRNLRLEESVTLAGLIKTHDFKKKDGSPFGLNDWMSMYGFGAEKDKPKAVKEKPVDAEANKRMKLMLAARMGSSA